MPSTAREQRLSAYVRGYTKRWQRESKRFLAEPEHMLCVDCKNQGYFEPATVVDHKVPHRGDQAKFWDRSNWNPLCVNCHNAKTRRGL